MSNFSEFKFSWERPVEEAMLEWLDFMASEMEKVVRFHDSKSIREGADCYAKAYRNAQRHLTYEISIRKRSAQKGENEKKNKSKKTSVGMSKNELS